jgi:Ohr subfamily peroxiredoxin
MKLYTAKASVTGGRNGHAETSDGNLKLDLATPGAPNTKPGTTNPEQLFACGYAACFGSALEYVAKQKKVSAQDATVNSEVTLNQGDDGFSISVALNVTVPGLSQPDAAALVQAAHQVCPYSKATRGNISVTLLANGSELSKAA